MRTPLVYMSKAAWRRCCSLASADLVVGLAAFLAAALFLSTYSILPGLTVFGHDEVHYYIDFSYKLGEDGRWLNFLLHDFLRSIPPGLWAALLLTASWVLFFRLARSLDFEPAYAALVAFTILLAYPFVEQSLWPATTIPAVVILLFASLLIERDIPYPIVYVLCGGLLFGTLQSFYFLLPLFFLRQFIAPLDSTLNSQLNSPANAPLIVPPPVNDGRWRLLMGHMVWWVLGAVLGVLAMSCILWLATGHFGVQPADWRRTQPMHDAAGLLRNLLYVADALWQQLVQLLQMALSGTDGDWFAAALMLAVLLRARALLAMHHAFLVLVAVLAAFFAFSIPLAPVIQTRSLVAMAAAVVLFVALVPGTSTAAGRSLGAVLILLLGYGFSIQGETYLARHDAQTTFFHAKLRELIPGYPPVYSAIAVFGTMDNAAPEASVFNEPALMHAIIHALGVQDYRDCRQGLDSRCDSLVTGEPIATRPFVRGQLLFYVDKDNVGIIRYQE